MAAPNLTSGDRMTIYRQVFLLNRAFFLVVRGLQELGQNKMLNPRDLRDMLGLTQEVQLEINIAVLNTLESVEQNGLAQFGKVRAAMENRIKG